MFGRATTFSNAVAQFDARLDQLSRNDAIAIQTLTMMAKQASISDASIFTACIIFRIITVRSVIVVSIQNTSWEAVIRQFCVLIPSYELLTLTFLWIL
jgi:hypothetical protein